MFVVAFDTSHGVGLTSAGLTICKNCTVISFQDIRNDRRCCIIVDFNLTGAQVITNIESELFRFLIDEGLVNENFSLLRDFDNGSVTLLNLFS